MPKNSQSGKKKAYRTPSLRGYGDIRQITRGATNSGSRDSGASSKPRKTGV